MRDIYSACFEFEHIVFDTYITLEWTFQSSNNKFWIFKISLNTSRTDMYNIKFFEFLFTFSLISNSTYLYIDLLWCSNFGDVCLMFLIWTGIITYCLVMFMLTFDGQQITRFLFSIYISTFNVFIPTFNVYVFVICFFLSFFFLFLRLPICLHVLSFLLVWWRTFEFQHLCLCAF